MCAKKITSKVTPLVERPQTIKPLVTEKKGLDVRNPPSSLLTPSPVASAPAQSTQGAGITSTGNSGGTSRGNTGGGGHKK